MRNGLLSLFALVLCAPASSQAALSLLHFDLGALTIIQDSSTTYSGFATWGPRFSLSDSMYVRADVGASLLKNDTKKFVAARAQALFGLKLSDTLGVEGGPGIQLWMEGTDADGKPIFAGASVRYRMNPTLEPFLAYSAIFIASGLTHEIRLGAGIHL